MASKLNIPLGELLLSIMALASKKASIRKFSHPSIFVAFQKLVEAHPEYFPGIYFHNLAGGIPHSRRIENILFRLGAWGSITVENPRFNYIQVKKEVINNIEDDIRKNYGTDAFNEIEKLGSEFVESVPTRECEK